MRRNSGSSLRELDLRVGPSRRNHHKIAFGAGLDKAAMAGLDKTAVALDKAAIGMDEIAIGPWPVLLPFRFVKSCFWSSEWPILCI